MDPVAVVIADDHAVVRVGLKTLLAQEPGYLVAGEAGDGLEAVRITHKVAPHVLILDLMMPRLNGLSVIREVKRLVPETRIIVLSMHASECYVAQTLRNGADGYIVKDFLSQEFFQAIRTVLAGSRYLSERFSRLAGPRRQETAGPQGAAGRGVLTVREREVLHLIAEGRANKEISTLLGISVRTVESHRARIMQKTGIHNHAALIHFAATQTNLEDPPL